MKYGFDKAKHRIHHHIFHHLCKPYLKHIHHVHGIVHNFFHIGELLTVGILGFVSFAAVGYEKLPNNDYLVYPLQKVSTLECRTMTWNDMPESCKIALPIIKGGTYSKYIDEKIYTDIYTVLWAANYQETWNQKIGAHAGVDIATAKGTPLYSVGDGKVFFAGEQAGYGKVVKIQYSYKGETIYAIYGHMSSLDVKTADTVRRGQKVGEVGNSGTTAGALGGYHVHFEITKDNMGRPMYGYNSCADVNKGHSTIIKQGLCRIELFANQYDPIRFIEDSQYMYSKTQVVVTTGYVLSNSTGTTSTTGEKQHIDNLSQFFKLTGSTSTGTNSVSSTNSTTIALDTSLVSELAQHFALQNTILLQSNLPNKVLKVGDTGIIALMITRKSDGIALDGLLSVPFDFVATTTAVSLSSSSVKLIDNGKIMLTVTAKKKGVGSVIVNLGGKKIAKILYLVE